MRALLTLLLARGSLMSAATSIAQEPAQLTLLISNQGYVPKVARSRTSQ